MKTVGNSLTRPTHSFLAILFFATAWCWMDRGFAQSNGITSLFPDAAQVAADYPDDTQRYVALNLLWDYSHEKAPDDASAKSKRSEYYNSSNTIRTKYLVMGDAPATQFDDRVRQLNSDRNFKRSVLEKYHLADIAAQAPPIVQNSGDVTDSMIQGIFWKALPVLVITLVLMLLIAKAMIRPTAKSKTFETPPFVLAPGLPPLPETLRVIKVPGLRYTVGFFAGLVVDKESVIHTKHVSTTTQPQSYTVGNDVYFMPGQTTTSSSSTKVDTVWLKTPDGRETSWTLSGDDFKSRAGHVISAISRRVAGDNLEFLMVYNHTTGQLQQLSTAVHTTRGWLAWLMTTFVGSIGFAIWIGMILSIDPAAKEPIDRLLSPLVYWLEGGLGAAIVAGFMVMRTQGKVMQSRYAAFQRNYLPGFQQFLAQATPSLERFFFAVK